MEKSLRFLLPPPPALRNMFPRGRKKVVGEILSSRRHIQRLGEIFGMINKLHSLHFSTDGQLKGPMRRQSVRRLKTPIVNRTKAFISHQLVLHRHFALCVSSCWLLETRGKQICFCTKRHKFPFVSMGLKILIKCLT